MGMRFIDRVRVSQEYSDWLKRQNEQNNFKMPFNPETFLAYLESKGMLNQFDTEKDEIYRLYKGMSDSMQVAVKDIMLVQNGEYEGE